MGYRGGGEGLPGGVTGRGERVGGEEGLPGEGRGYQQRGGVTRRGGICFFKLDESVPNRGIIGSPCSPPSTCTIVCMVPSASSNMDTNGTTDSSTPRNPSNMALREMRSYALIPSTEEIVSVALISVIACNACATHSHLARVDSAF